MGSIKVIDSDCFKIMERDVLAERTNNIKAVGVFGCPSDEKELDEIAVDLLNVYDLRVFVCKPGINPDEEDARAWAKEFALIVFAVSDDFVSSDNFARTVMLPVALDSKVRILPVRTVGAGNIGSVFSKICGNLHLLDRNSPDYQSRLKEYYDEHVDPYYLWGISKEQNELREHLFRCKAFISYRKKDIAQLRRLIDFIREIPELRDMAIFYDDSLIPGEFYDKRLSGEISEEDIVIFVVTPSLLEDGNYVIREEYPQAEKEGKTMIPVLMADTDIQEVKTIFPEFGEIYDFSDKDALREKLIDVRKSIGELASLTPEYKHFLALAYEKGEGTERNIRLSYQLLKEAFEAGNISSMAYMTIQHLEGRVADEYEGETEDMLTEAMCLFYSVIPKTQDEMVKVIHATSLQRFASELYDRLWGKESYTHYEIRRTIICLQSANITLRKAGVVRPNYWALPNLRMASLYLFDGNYEAADIFFARAEESLKEAVDLSNHSTNVMIQVMQAHMLKAMLMTRLMLRGDYLVPKMVLKARDINEKAIEIWMEISKLQYIPPYNIMFKNEHCIARIMQKMALNDELDKTLLFMKEFNRFTDSTVMADNRDKLDLSFDFEDILHFDLTCRSLAEMKSKLDKQTVWYEMDASQVELHDMFMFKGGIPEGVFGDVEGNYYASGYKCYDCETRLYKVVFPQGNDPVLKIGFEGSESIEPARVFVCPRCGKFFAVPKGRKFVQGPVYQLSPFMDRNNKVGKAFYDMWWTYFDQIGDINAQRLD